MQTHKIEKAQYFFIFIKKQQQQKKNNNKKKKLFMCSYIMYVWNKSIHIKMSVYKQTKNTVI